MQTFDPEVIEFTAQLQRWHESRVANLKLLLDNPTAELKIGSVTIESDSDLAKGLRIGVSLALDQLGKLPFSVTPCMNEEEDE